MSRLLTFGPRTTWAEKMHELRWALVNEGEEVDVGEWQAQKVSHPLQITVELENVCIQHEIPETSAELATEIQPNMPWAEDQFQERVSRIPHNPPPSHAWWPHAQKTNEEHLEEGLFSHTYPERFWPAQTYEEAGASRTIVRAIRRGIRFPYGDLDDVVRKLVYEPLTRQAVLAVWHPEDQWAMTEGHRVPCSLTYHFMARRGRLNVQYVIRSCDFVRHFADDAYMAARLGQWVRSEVNKRSKGQVAWSMGQLTMTMHSLHVFKGDIPKLSRELVRR